MIKTVVGQELLDHRQLFLSKRAAASFGHYADAQLRRLQNAIARDTLPQPSREEHILKSVNHALDDFAGSYIMDYRVYRNGTWEYVRKTITEDTASISVGTSPIDHIRVYPEGCLPESYTWDKAGNLLSRTDARGVTESYRYDSLGRLVGIYDNEGKKVEEYEYNYKNR